MLMSAKSYMASWNHMLKSVDELDGMTNQQMLEKADPKSHTVVYPCYASACSPVGTTIDMVKDCTTVQSQHINTSYNQICAIGPTVDHNPDMHEL